MKLNYRDKVILGIVLALFIIIGGYIGLVKPKRALIKDNEDKKTEVEDKRDQLQRRIDTSKGLVASIEETYEKADKISKVFVTKSEIDQTTLLDKFMQQYADKCNLRVTELKLDDTAANTISYYYKPYKEVATSLRESADINGSLQKQVSADSQESKIISERSVETIMSTRYGFTAYGTKKDTWSYLDMINKYDKTAIITYFGFEKYDGDVKKPDAANNSQDQNQNQNQNEEKESSKLLKLDEKGRIDDNEALESNIVIQLYSVYNMEKPNTD